MAANVNFQIDNNAAKSSFRQYVAGNNKLEKRLRNQVNFARIEGENTDLGSKKHARLLNSGTNFMTTILGIGVISMIIIGTGLSSKGSFAKNIAKKGLELKDNLLINSKTGEKYTGTIKSNVGKIGFNKVESQKYENGVITEKIYKNIFGREKSGIFYKDGKECLKVKIGYPYFVPYNKSVAAYRYSEDKTAAEHYDMSGFSFESVFEWARNLVKKEGWLNK